MIVHRRNNAINIFPLHTASTHLHAAHLIVLHREFCDMRVEMGNVLAKLHDRHVLLINALSLILIAFGKLFDCIAEIPFAFLCLGKLDL